VGGLAAAVCAHLWETWGTERPRFVVVEPADAACMLASAEAGRLTSLAGNLETMMTCLACGEASLLAWDVLRHGADHFLAIPDEAEQEALSLLEQGTGSDPPLPLGPSGAAGLAGLLSAAHSAPLRQALALVAHSRVLLIGSEAPQHDEE
jgi:diaminopropionate ammonia-lyase